MLYVGAITSIKMAFLNLYLNIFPNFGLRNAIYIVMGIVVAFLFAFFFGVCFNCLPVSYIWTSWTGETTGNCLDFNSFGIACAVINIVLDVTVMALPLHEIMKLNLRPMKKLLVMLMFCTGFLWVNFTSWANWLLTKFGQFQHHHCKHHSPQVSGDICPYNQCNLYEISFKAGD